jgi:ankyrin repeat protein
MYKSTSRENGWTGLMLATRYGHINAIKIFLEQG